MLYQIHKLLLAFFCLLTIMLSLLRSLHYNRKFITIFIFVAANFSLAAQSSKPIIDTGMLFTWPSLRATEKPAISVDGQYVAYVIHNHPLEQETFVIQNSNASWKKEFISKCIGSDYFFSSDGKKVFWTSSDTLFLWTLQSGELNLILSVSTFQTPQFKKGEWVAYQLQNDSTLYLLDLCSEKKLKYENVKKYLFSANGNVLVFSGTGKREAATTLQWVNLTQGSTSTIWKGKDGYWQKDPVFDKQAEQIAFIVQENGNESSVWYYSERMEKAIKKVNNNTNGIPVEYRISNSFIQFSGNGKWLFWGLKKKGKSILPNPDITQVDIWSYKDWVINPAQETGSRDLTGAINVESDKAIIIEKNEEEKLSTQSVGISGDYVIITKEPDNPLPWVKSFYSSYWLMSLTTGEKFLLRGESSFLTIHYSFSPDGKWVVYWDCDKAAYISYNINTGKFYNITQNLPPVSKAEDEIFANPESDNLAGWYKGDSSLLIYDRYDIWKVDPAGRKAPINLTNGYGAKNRIKLRLVYETDVWALPPVFTGDEELLLTGFNTSTKYNGFYSIKLNKKRPPIQLTAGPYTYFRLHSQKGHGYAFSDGMQPVKASGAAAWIVRRESSKEFPNYFYTRDFKAFVPLTSLQPQKAYNWLTSELITYKQLDGTVSQGVLYKPENFDSTKKYPLIFNYYEKLSHRLYEFPMPGFTFSNINVPWFVSRGYLVFTPDIYYSVAANNGGKTTGEAAYNSIVGAATHLAKLPYIDGKKMGLQGHSFGGGETNYLVTHCKLFAAASEAAGGSDYLSSYLTLVGYPIEKTLKQDHPQGRMGATPWERLDLYIRNSSVIKANEATAPLLIFHNKKDRSINFRQGVEMYLALRRLGKPCWLLQYDGSDHSLNGKDALDFSIRITQFFDHYLKGAPAPRWMTQNTMAKYKGKENLFELDPDGICGENCVVCKKYRKSTQTLRQKENSHKN